MQHKDCSKDCVKKQIKFYLSGNVYAKAKHYFTDIGNHSIECRIALSKKIYEAAINDNSQAVMFWLLCYGGWKLPEESN